MTWFIFILLVFIAAVSGGVFKPGEWYEGLHKPGWTPPDWAFPVVWGFLYAGIAWAGVLIWKSDGPKAPALAFWGAQWLFNTAWSWLFFGRKRMDQALVDVILLWLSVLGFIVFAWAASPLASVLFLPYLAWVSIAGALNAKVWQLNPGERRTA